MADAQRFLHLSDAPARILIECSICGRRGEYSRDRAIAERGDLLLPDFLAQVRNCSNFAGVNSNQCGARYAPQSLPK